LDDAKKEETPKKLGGYRNGTDVLYKWRQFEASFGVSLAAGCKL
jgi:hypothetical protein